MRWTALPAQFQCVIQVSFALSILIFARQLREWRKSRESRQLTSTRERPHTMDRRNRVFIIAICIFVAGITSIRSIKQSRLPIRDCQISEFTCNNRRCISAEKYCDNIEDCGDGSDEPRFCSSKFVALWSMLNWPHFSRRHFFFRVCARYSVCASFQM